MGGENLAFNQVTICIFHHHCVSLAGVQSRDPEADIPREISSRERDIVSTGTAGGQNHRDAPRAQGESARTIQSGRSQQEEIRQISMLWSHDVQHPLG